MTGDVKENNNPASITRRKKKGTKEPASKGPERNEREQEPQCSNNEQDSQKVNPDDSETEKEEEERSTVNDKLNMEREVSLSPSPERTLMKSPRKKDEHNESMDDVEEKIKVKKRKKGRENLSI